MNQLLKKMLLVCAGLFALAGQAMADSLSDAKRAYGARNYAGAEKLFRALADQGDVEAQTRLGFMYEFGRGVQIDYKEVVKWYRLAAKQGDAYAQWSLGAMYENGRGVPKDYKEAIRWYRLAAEQGNALAQAKLNAVNGEVALVSEGDAVTQVKAEKEELAAKQTAEAVSAPASSPEMPVERSVKDWAVAWSAKDTHDYLAAYASDFKPKGMNRDAWKKQRVARIRKAKVIEVTLSDIKFSAQDDSHVTVSFIQNYRSDGYRNQAGKTLRMVKQSDRWLIAEERADKAAKINAKTETQKLAMTNDFKK